MGATCRALAPDPARHRDRRDDGRVSARAPEARARRRVATVEIVLGLAAGVLLARRRATGCSARRDVHVGELRGASVRLSVLVFGVLLVHSLPEGLRSGPPTPLNGGAEPVRDPRDRAPEHSRRDERRPPDGRGRLQSLQPVLGGGSDERASARRCGARVPRRRARARPARLRPSRSQPGRCWRSSPSSSCRRRSGRAAGCARASGASPEQPRCSHSRQLQASRGCGLSSDALRKSRISSDGLPPMAADRQSPRLSGMNTSEKGVAMRDIFKYGGFVASAVLIAFGVVHRHRRLGRQQRPRQPQARADHGHAGHDPRRDQGGEPEGRPDRSRIRARASPAGRSTPGARRSLRQLHANPRARGNRWTDLLPDGPLPRCEGQSDFGRDEGREGSEDRPAGRERASQPLGDRDLTHHSAQHVLLRRARRRSSGS